MLIKILGGIDLIVGLILVFELLKNLPIQIIVITSTILILKAAMGMLKNFASWIDFLTAIIFLLSLIISIPSWIAIIIGILIIQKGLISFI